MGNCKKMASQRDPLITSDIKSGVSLLLRKTNNINTIKLHELDYTQTRALAFNVDKSEHIFICLRRDLKSGQFADDATVLFIALHELAHTMHQKFDPHDEKGFTIHSPQFKKYERFLMTVTENMGVLKPSMIIGTAHCGSVIMDPSTAI